MNPLHLELVNLIAYLVDGGHQPWRHLLQLITGGIDFGGLLRYQGHGPLHGFRNLLQVPDLVQNHLVLLGHLPAGITNLGGVVVHGVQGIENLLGARILLVHSPLDADDHLVGGIYQGGNLGECLHGLDGGLHHAAD